MQIKKILFLTLMIIFLQTITIIYSQFIPTQPVFLKNLINYLQVKSGTNQVFLIIDNHHLDDLRTQLLQIPKNCPTQIVDFHCLKERKFCFENYPFLHDPREVNLFLIAPSVNISKFSIQTNLTIDFLIEISKGNTRPKCLFVLSPKTKEDELKFKTLLKNMWHRQFLDVTILEINKFNDSSRKSETVRRENGKIMAMKENSSKYYSAKLLQYNPFLKRFSISQVSSKSIWFLEKLANLHQERMKTSFLSLLPLVNVTRNTSGHVTKISGTDANIINFLAKVMNFSLTMIPHNFSDFGSFNPNGIQEPGLTDWLTRNEINLIGNRIFGRDHTDRDWLEVGQPIDQSSLLAIVPIQMDKVSSLDAVGKMFISLSVSSTMLLILFAVAKILKFDLNLWQPLNLFRIFLGSSVELDTKKVADRLMFTLILFTSMILSMHFYDICTNLSIYQEVQREMNTLDDLIDSQMDSEISGSLKGLLIEYSEDSVKIVLENARGMRANKVVDCFERLAKNRNICCIANSFSAKFALLSYLDNEDQPIVKVIPEILHSSWFYLFFERGSPYAPRFNDIILRMKESGIRDQLEERVTVKKSEQVMNGSESKEFEKINELLRFFFYAFVIVDCLSILVFCLEIFSYVKNFPL